MTSQLILQNSCISSTLDEPSFLLFPGNQGNWNFFPKSCLFQSLKPASCNQIRNSVTRSRQQRNTKIKQKGDHSWKYTIFSYILKNGPRRRGPGFQDFFKSFCSFVRFVVVIWYHSKFYCILASTRHYISLCHYFPRSQGSWDLFTKCCLFEIVPNRLWNQQKQNVNKMRQGLNLECFFQSFSVNKLCFWKSEILIGWEF